MTVSFQLTMPNVGSWNGKWSGASREYFVIREFFKTRVNHRNGAYASRIIELLDGKPCKGFYYRWEDGWGANVTMEIIDAKEAKRRRKASSGFCGYEWMIDSIIKHGKILSTIEEKSLLTH
jgi:hypothetical protein